MSSLGTSINISPSKGGLGVSIVSAGMSFSVATTVFVWNTYANKAHCDEVNLDFDNSQKILQDNCWREYVRLLSYGCLLFPLPGKNSIYSLNQLFQQVH